MLFSLCFSVYYYSGDEERVSCVELMKMLGTLSGNQEKMNPFFFLLFLLGNLIKCSSIRSTAFVIKDDHGFLFPQRPQNRKTASERDCS